MVTELAEEYCLPLKMTQTPDLGFHATYFLPKKVVFKKDDVPDIFTEVKHKNRTVHLLTDEMFNLNVRINRAMEEIQLITNVVIYDLVESLKGGMSYLYRLCDRVAELDLLSSLAQASSTTDYIRPVFGSQISLVGARHPILDHLCRTKPIPNNFNASRSSNFAIITGPNMSGKTVYVLTVPLIQIMAQVGCYVPADKAELRITDHIYVRKGTVDNMQSRLSSHGSEIKELCYTLKTLTGRSLIILDELCTSCSCQKGICLAWAFSEEFLKTSCFTFLTTHYHYLCNLSKVYKNVKNFHMEAIEKTPNAGESYWDLTFTFRLLPGKTKMTDYALRLMMASALPDEVKQYALAVAKDIAQRRENSLPVCVVDDPDTVKELAKIEKVENFMSNLKALCMTDKFTPKLFRSLQKMIREEILPDMRSDDEISLEGTDETLSTPKQQTAVSPEPQNVVDEAVNEYLQGEVEDQALERNKNLPGSGVEESPARSKFPSADNMDMNENMTYSLNERTENCNAIFSNPRQQELREAEDEDHYNINVMYSNLDELKHSTPKNARYVPSEENVESGNEEDDAVLYSGMEESKDPNYNQIETYEEQNDDVLYPGRNESQNVIDLNGMPFPPENQIEHNEEEANYDTEYLEQHTPQNIIINNRTDEAQFLGAFSNESAHSSGVKRTEESKGIVQFEASQELPNIFSIEHFTDSDEDFKDCEESSELNDSSSSSSEGSYYINNNLS
ncbi:unnamed protein product [Nezara viridula]|uniref:DNA mismatch repair proteins mutS family domain-containing protein n=1 Tax=Nezara viridula TaxID=85310 RepID=A0A9P0H9C0_NEZVI|nr:unnamed protein product [Nezara viridula]